MVQVKQVPIWYIQNTVVVPWYFLGLFLKLDMVPWYSLDMVLPYFCVWFIHYKKSTVVVLWYSDDIIW